MPLFPVLVARPRAGAYEAAREAGYIIVRRQIDAKTAGEADACNAFLAGYDDLAALRRERRKQIDAELTRRLTLQLSLARLLTIGGAGIKLLAKNSGLTLANWPEADRRRLLTLVARFDRANAILEAAEALEAVIDAASLAVLREVDVTQNRHWPA